MVEVILEEVVFEIEIVVILKEIIGGIEMERIGGIQDSQG